MKPCTSAASSTAPSRARATASHVAAGGTGSVVRSASTLPFILMVTTSGTVAGGGGWMGGEKQGGAWVNGVVGGADDGVSGGGAEGTRLMVLLSSAKNDSAATGAESFCSSANNDARFAESVSTS